MRNEGTRVAQIAANIHLWSKLLYDRMIVCPGCSWSGRWSSFSIGFGLKKAYVYPSVEKACPLADPATTHWGKEVKFFPAASIQVKSGAEYYMAFFPDMRVSQPNELLALGFVLWNFRSISPDHSRACIGVILTCAGGTCRF